MGRESTVKEFVWRTSFAKTIASGIDPDWGSLVALGAGQAISQSNGNLVLTSGTTANAETIARSRKVFNNNMTVRAQVQLSQRIANNNFVVELVDVLGDGLAFTVNSSTSVTVALPGHTFDATNVGQSISLGAIAGGLSGAIPGRFAIASVVPGVSITLTVAGWPSSGSGTCTLYGWNFHRVLYDGTTATSAKIDAGRRGWASGDTTITINTSASAGHIIAANIEDGVVSWNDGLAASSAALALVPRGSRQTNIPDNDVPLWLQVRATNGSTAPASTTTLTMGFLGVEEYDSEKVTIASVRAQGFNGAMPIMGTGSGGRVSVSLDAGATGSSAVQMQGTAAHDAVSAGNPIYVGGIARTSNAAGVANGDAAGQLMNVVGAVVQLPYAIPESTWQYGSSTAITNTTDVAVKAAAAAGIRNYMTGLQYHNTSATASVIVVKDGSTVIWASQAPASMAKPAFMAFPVPLRGTAATAMNVAMLTTGTNTFVAAQGFIAP